MSVLAVDLIPDCAGLSLLCLRSEGRAAWVFAWAFASFLDALENLELTRVLDRLDDFDDFDDESDWLDEFDDEFDWLDNVDDEFDWLAPCELLFVKKLLFDTVS